MHTETAKICTFLRGEKSAESAQLSRIESPNLSSGSNWLSKGLPLQEDRITAFGPENPNKEPTAASWYLGGN